MATPVHPSRNWRSYRYKRTTLILLGSLSVLSGLGLARVIVLPQGLYYWVLGPVAILACYVRTHAALAMVIVIGLVFGCWRGDGYRIQLDAYNDLYYQPVSLTITAHEDATYGTTKQLAFTGGEVQTDDGQQLVGKLQISGFGENAVFQGDVVQVEGKLYPSRSAYQGRISFAKLTILEHHPSIITNIRRKFAAGTQSALPEPLAPFVMGILIGQRASLPDDVKTNLQHVGLTHIIAVSGYNLTIILQASRRLFDKQSKRIATFLSVALIGVFLLIAGASASIVRAAIVSMLSITAGYYGRVFKPLNLLAMSAVITAWVNPVYIWSDLSWYLSFLAFYGVMVLGPLIQARWPGKWHDSIIVGVALESISAEIMTLPFVLYIFGQMSRISLLANILVVSLVPLAMLLGTIAGLAGMLCGSFSGWFAWPANILLNYMLDTARILANMPAVFVEGIGFNLVALIMCYAVIALLTAVLMHKTKPAKPATITDRTEQKYRGMLA